MLLLNKLENIPVYKSYVNRVIIYMTRFILSM
nr:MAG TPA: hypothetical protein [Caudoviricetes sp.]